MTNRRYTVIKAPFGALYLTAENNELVRITPEKPPSLAAARRDDVPVLTRTAREITRFLYGQQAVTSLVPQGRFSPFQNEVYNAVCRIPYGETDTSSHIASVIGKPYAVRAVETLCRDNPYWIAIPCHRVLLHGERTDTTDTPLDARESLRRLEKRYCQKQHPAS